MDEELKAITDAFEQDPPSGADYSFLGFHVMPNITPRNVKEVLKLLSAHPELNKEFWSIVNNAPDTDMDWAAMRFIGSAMSDEALQERSRQRLRRAVEIVRNEVGDIHLRRAALFRRG